MMFTPFENHTTDMAASIYARCAVTHCQKHANPVNVITAELNIFGNPEVTVTMCDEHYVLLGPVTDEQKPDIVADEER